MLTNETGLSAADVAAVMNGNGNANGFGWGDNSFWLVILFLFMFNGGWNNGFGSGPNIVNDVQRGFDQNALINGINGVQTSLVNGFAGVNQGMCNGFAGVSNGFAQAEIGANNRQMSNMNQMFGLQQSISGLGYNIATEACADRQAVNDGVRDLMASNTANTQALLNTINGGIQSIQDKLCQQEVDALKAENSRLQTQINLANLQASQGSQTAQILADNAAQTARLLPQAPIPAYVVSNPNGCCQQNACGCGSF